MLIVMICSRLMIIRISLLKVSESSSVADDWMINRQVFSFRNTCFGIYMLFVNCLLTVLTGDRFPLPVNTARVDG